MASSFRAFLVNDLFGDPALYVGLPWERRALLFDLGDISRLSAGHLLKISDVFVSHAHLDHFVGFDQLLRVLLGRSKALRLYGPTGFIDHVDGKLRGYVWNLVDGYSLVIEVHEIGPDRVRCARFVCPNGFRREEAAPGSRSTASFSANRSFGSAAPNWITASRVWALPWRRRFT